MSCCCTNTLNFCRQSVCGEIDFDILAQVSGVHKLVTYYLGVMKVSISENFTIGEKIIFPLSGLNENYQYTSELFDPNGAKIIINKNEVEYDCFKFQTVIELNAVEVAES